MPSKLDKIFDIEAAFSTGPLLHSIGQLEQQNIQKEEIIGFTGARIIYVNYKLLQHDFPQLRTAHLCDQFPKLKALRGKKQREAIQQRIEEWLIQNVSFVSTSQVMETRINSPIPITEKRVHAWRPPRYGRALVMSMKENEKRQLFEPQLSDQFENRLIDVKGVGVAPDKTPEVDAHSTGLLPLNEALIELLNQVLIQSIFKHSKSAFNTIPIYGILDTGFDILNENNGTANPAGILVRRAHQRPGNPGGLGVYGSKLQKIQVAVELLLRKYGISSSNNVTTVQVWKEEGNLRIKYGSQDIDFYNEEQLATIEEVSHYKDGMDKLIFKGINVQHTKDVVLNPPSTHLVDFGTYRVFANFPDPILSLVSDKLLRWGGTIWPDYDDFVQPDPKLCIPYNVWGASGDMWGYPGRENRSKQDTLCEGLAKSFRKNELSREMLLATLNIYLNTATKNWKK